MANSPAPADLVSTTDPARPGEYVVVARRYRPQTFEELVGQEHVARAMSNAITSGRVGHAYLFTGARGVGKTSSARILAKALNCVEGPTPTPCNRCEICQAISSGDDVDVLEIDGASNRRIEEMRNLRQNVNIRPSRARFKIYIIDEVHMLTNEAFNALLKTLEEPPEHVKFIFCTTEPEKIPITILSRCQRFDFAGIQAPSIVGRLRQIVEAEGVEAEPEALEILARRAAGSMRDSQSLLEQLLAFGGRRIGAADVHAMLGTAADGRLGSLVGHLVDRNASAALADIDEALAEGVDVGQMLEQLLGYFRDCMAAAVGCRPESFLYAGSGEQQAVTEAGRKLGLETILAVLQIIDQTLSRLRYSTHRRTLAELAVVRICALEDLEELSSLVGQMQGSAASPPAAGVNRARQDAPASSAAPAAPSSQPVPPAAKKKSADDEAELSPSADVEESPRPSPTVDLSPANALSVWKQALENMNDMTSGNASMADVVAISGPNRLVVSFPGKYTYCKTYCETPERTAAIESAISELVGNRVRIEFRLLEESRENGNGHAASPRPAPSRSRPIDKSQHPMVRRAAELFKARPVGVEESEVHGS